MFPLKHEEVASFDVLTLASREHACSMEEQTVALRGSQWFLSLGSVTSGLEKSLLASYGESTPGQNALRMNTKFNIRSALTWLESVTEKETGNAHPAAYVDVLPRCLAGGEINARNEATIHRPTQQYTAPFLLVTLRRYRNSKYIFTFSLGRYTVHFTNVMN